MKRSHRWFTPWLLVAPALIWVIVFSIWPFLNTVILSFTNARPLRATQPVGFDNYTRLFSDSAFGYAITTSLVYVLVCVPLLTFLPLLLAQLVEKKIPGIGFFRTTFYFPVVASVVAVGLIWAWLFSSDGIVNQAMQFLGLQDQPTAFLVNRWSLIFVSILLTVWQGLGYYMVVYLAALGNVGRELHEAAMIDGAGGFRRFMSVTIPGVRGAILLVSSLVAVAAMRVFSEIYVLSGGTGGPGGQAQSIVMLIKLVGGGIQGQTGSASAISVVLFLLTIGPLLVNLYLNRERKAKV